MSKRTLGLTLAAVLASVSSAPPARADCCDDFWSCLSTIATFGASCKAQQIAPAIEGTKKMIVAVERTRAGFKLNADATVSGTQKVVRSASDTMKGDLQRSLDGIRTSMSDTEIVVRKQMVQPSPQAGTAGAGAVAMAPADSAQVQADLKRALEWVQAANQNAETSQAPIVRNHADEAPKQVKMNETPARKTVDDRLLSPLAVVSKDLERMLETILNSFDFSSVTRLVDQQIKEIQVRAPTTFDMMEKQLSSDAQDQLMAGQKKLDDVNKLASDVKKVADQAKRLAESGKKADLDKLEALIGKPPTDEAAFAPGVESGKTARAPGSGSVASVALLKTQGTAKVARLRAQDLSSGLVSQWDATRKLLPAGPVIVTPAMQQKVSGDLSKMFAGKSFPDARKKQQELLEEARVKFASDPKTFAAVEKYLQAQTSSLVAASSAPIRK